MDDVPEGFTLEDSSQKSSDLPEGFTLDHSSDVPDGFQLEDEKYSTPGQQALAGAEGAAEGFAGPFATAAELGLSKLGVPGLSAEDQSGRASANPITHGVAQAAGLGAGLYTGIGEAGLLARAIPEIEATGRLAKIGSAALKGAIENGIIGAGSETSKHMLGQVDPQDATSSAIVNIGGSVLLGGLTHGAFKGTSQELRALDNAKAGTKMQEFLAGIGNAAKPGSIVSPMGDSEMYELGGKFYNEGIPTILAKGSDAVISGAAGTAASLVGSPLVGRAVGQATTTAVDKLLGPTIEKIVDKQLTPAAQKIAYPVVLKMLKTGNTTGLFDALDHAGNVSGGAQKINSAVGNIFKLGSQRVVDEAVTDKEREKIKQHLEDGGVDSQLQQQMIDDNKMPSPQGFAKGGEVKPALQDTNALATHFPEQAMLMGMAKGRVSNYLNSLRPQQNPQKLPYDKDPNMDKKNKSFNAAIDIAAKPLTILNKVKDGSITSEEMNHFHQLYPDVYAHLSKKITEQIINQQIKGESPHYKTRQGLSLFLGAPMDGSFTPANIQAAQSVFLKQRAQNASAAQPGNVKKGTSKLGDLSKQLQTSEQAAQSRQIEK